LEKNILIATPAVMSVTRDVNPREYAWNQSCDDAIKHFDETGLHATHDQVMTWMDT
jgi:uncharacterized membrane protein